MFQNLGAFVAVSVVVICTPGPDTALIIRNTLSWLTLYAVVVAKAGQFLRGRVRRALDAVTGTILVAFGIRLATER